MTKSFNTDHLNSFCINKKVFFTKIEFLNFKVPVKWLIFVNRPVIPKCAFHNGACVRGNRAPGWGKFPESSSKEPYDSVNQ